MHSRKSTPFLLGSAALPLFPYIILEPEATQGPAEMRGGKVTGRPGHCKVLVPTRKPGFPGLLKQHLTLWAAPGPSKPLCAPDGAEEFLLLTFALAVVPLTSTVQALGPQDRASAWRSGGASVGRGRCGGDEGQSHTDWPAAPAMHVVCPSTNAACL